MESCCVEEFLPSAAIEGIWGFTRAIAMVGGVSLVIFFSLCKWMDSKLSAIGMQTVNIFHKHKNPLPLRLLCFLTDQPTFGNHVCSAVKNIKKTTTTEVQQVQDTKILLSSSDNHTESWKSHWGFRSACSASTFCGLGFKDKTAYCEVCQTAVIFLLVLPCSPPPPYLLSGVSHRSILLFHYHPHHLCQDSIGWFPWKLHRPLEKCVS